MPKQAIFYIPEEDIPNIPDISISYQYLDFVENWLKEKNIQPKRGDAILVKDAYLNDGRVFWNGFKVIHQEYSRLGNGSIPLEFSFPEFSISYFKNCEGDIPHINLDLRRVNLDKDQINQSLTDARLSDLFLEKDYNGILGPIQENYRIRYKTFVYQGETYYIVLIKDDEEDMVIEYDLEIFFCDFYDEDYRLINHPEDINNHIFFN